MQPFAEVQLCPSEGLTNPHLNQWKLSYLTLQAGCLGNEAEATALKG